MAEEGEKVLERALLWLQKQEEDLKDGFALVYEDKEYVFLPEFIDRYFIFTLLRTGLKISFYRNDKKMDRLLTGVGDGCDSCLIPRKLWTDMDTIEDGFPMSRTIENIRETWAVLEKDKDGEVIKRRDDYLTRQGLCHPPVTLRETWSFTLTHKVIKIVFT